MSEAVPQPAVPVPPAPAARPRRRHILGRWTRRILILALAVVCGLLVTFVTVDIGSWFDIRHRAEKAATGYLNDRQFHIGAVHALLWPGAFAVDDVRVDGLHPGDRPFLVAKKVTCHVQWTDLILRKRLVLDVTMNDWQMLVEQWADGSVSMPRFGKPSNKKLPIEIRVASVAALEGSFEYEDHGTPWGVVAPKLAVRVIWSDAHKRYVGDAAFAGGTVQIQNFLPMKTDFAATLSIEPGKPVQIENIDLVTDGAVSKVKGTVNFANWPEQSYDVQSRVNFPRMRELFFANESWRVSGEGDFHGKFQLFKGGRDLSGDFTSATAVLRVKDRDFAFPALRGSLRWTRDRFDVVRADSQFFGGTTSFAYGLGPFGKPGGATATFAAAYDGVDVDALTRLFHWRALQVAGSAHGRQTMTWANGHLSQTITGDGELAVSPPSGVALATAQLPAPLQLPARASDQIETSRRAGQLAIGGDARYRIDPDGLTFGTSWAATPSSYAAFDGRYTFEGSRLDMPVHVASRDAQESDRLLAAILSERGSPTNIIAVGGAFTFDGRLTETLSNLRADGHFDGDSIYAFANIWGKTTGDIVLANNAVDVKSGVVSGASPGSRLDINGHFALGLRQVPTVEEMRATIHVERWPLSAFKRSFNLEDWPIDGTGTADLNLHGPYKRLLGDGSMRIASGVAWNEPFDTADGTLTFEGTELSVNPVRIVKGTGTIRGTTSISWTNNTYTFDVDGENVAVDTIQNFSSPKAKLTGVLAFNAQGNGSFSSPVYTFRGRIPDLFVGDQGIGAVAGTLSVRNRIVTINQLQISGLGEADGHGTISFDDKYTSELFLVVTAASIDPYLKFFTDASWFQHTKLIAGGNVHILGPLGDLAALTVRADISDAQLTLFDYVLENDGPFSLAYQDKTFTIGRPGCDDATAATCHLSLKGAGTQVQLSGFASSSGIDVVATGTAGLAILRGFQGLEDVVASGSADINARLVGNYGTPHFSGQADLNDAAIRVPWLPRGLENLTGRITMNPTGVSFDGVSGHMGDGTVTFGGTIGFNDYRPDEFNLTMDGRGVNLRDYPRGFDSIVDARLSLRGPFESPLLSGDVDVKRVRLQTQIEPDVSLIALAAGGGAADSQELGVPVERSIRVHADVHVHAPPMRLIDSHDLWIAGSTDDLTIRGTFDQPVITGRIDVTGGQMIFSGNRFTIQPGSIEFTNPSRLDPSFNITAEADPRVPGQIYHVVLTAKGTLDKPAFEVRSEPWLSQNDIYALLLGGTPDPGKVEIRSLRSPQQYETELMATITAQFLAAKSGVTSIFEKTLPFDTVQLTPTLLSSDVALQNQTLNPSARLTLGKRISDRIYLIYSRDLTNSATGLNEFIILQFDQNDRLQWALSRNEDRSFALDFRFRHIF